MTKRSASSIGCVPMSTRLSSETLETLARRRRFAARSLHVAKRLLVDQAPARLVAAEFDLHLSRIYAIRRQILNAALEARSGQANALPEPRPDRWLQPSPSDGVHRIRVWTAPRGPGGSQR